MNTEKSINNVRLIINARNNLLLEKRESMGFTQPQLEKKELPDEN